MILILKVGKSHSNKMWFWLEIVTLEIYSSLQSEYSNTLESYWDEYPSSSDDTKM